MTMYEVRSVLYRTHRIPDHRDGRRWKILTGDAPLEHIPSEHYVELVVRGDTRPTPPDDLNIPDGLWPLVERCWLNNASGRPTAGQVCDDLKSILAACNASGRPTAGQVCDDLKSILDTRNAVDVPTPRSPRSTNPPP